MGPSSASRNVTSSSSSTSILATSRGVQPPRRSHKRPKRMHCKQQTFALIKLSQSKQANEHQTATATTTTTANSDYHRLDDASSSSLSSAKRSLMRNKSEQLEERSKYYCDRPLFIATTATTNNHLNSAPAPAKPALILSLSALLLWLLLLLLLCCISQPTQAQTHLNQTIATTSGAEQQSFSGAQLLPASNTQQNHHHNNNKNAAASDERHLIGAHLQPSFVYGARNKSANFTHLLVDELTNSVYVGATNLLLQLSALNLRPEYALKTGPAQEDSRDCAPADCLAQLAHLDTSQLQAHHAQGPDLSLSQQATPAQHLQPGRVRSGATMRTTPMTGVAARLISNSNVAGGSQVNQQHYNNYNKILAIEPDSRQLIVCGSLNQGACRRHQLGQLGNFSELIPLPVAPNDEHSSAAALVVSGRTGAGYPGGSGAGAGAGKQRPVLYVAATNSRLGPYREMVPAISARYLEPANRAMQIIERSFTDSARVDISFELRDYYLVNYTYAFQHNEYIYFATVQRRSPLRQLEEWGYISRLARLCLNDLSFQSYAEITIECRTTTTTTTATNKHSSSSAGGGGGGGGGGEINYNLLQDAQVTPAGSTLAHQLGIKSQSSVLVAAFALSKDHTARSQQKSAICLYPMEKIEQKFTENIHTCYNGSSKARNMNYIAGSVNDCPKAGKAGNIANFCHEPLKLNGSLPLIGSPIVQYHDELLTSIVATQAPTSPLNIQQASAAAAAAANQAANARQHQVLLAGTSDGSLKRIAIVPGKHGIGVRGIEFDSIQLDEHRQEPILADMHLLPGQLINELEPAQQQFVLAATPHRVAKMRVNACKAISLITNKQTRTHNSTMQVADECQLCAHLEDPYCGWCATTNSCLARDECLRESMKALASSQSTANWSKPLSWQPFDQIRCNDYLPLAPQFVALQSSLTSHLAPSVDVNIRLEREAIRGASSTALALQLAQAQFSCHFDYSHHLTSDYYAKQQQQQQQQHSAANHTNLLFYQERLAISGATTKATQARLNLHTLTVVVACPLPPTTQRPSQVPFNTDQLKTRLTVRLANANHLLESQHAHLSVLRGFWRSALAAEAAEASSTKHHQQQQQVALAGASQQDQPIERELTFYDCSVHTSCRSCLTSGSSRRQFACSWCPLSNRCTFNASHSEFGCAASAIAAGSGQTSTTASSALKASHLAASLDQTQASVLGASIDQVNQCWPGQVMAGEQSNLSDAPRFSSSDVSGSSNNKLSQQLDSVQTPPLPTKEVLIPNEARRSIQVSLSKALGNLKRAKLECLVEIEGAKARLPAKLIELAGQQTVIACQESSFSYQDELASQHGQLTVILNDNQVIESTNVLLYKCHLFGVSPPTLTSAQSSSAWRSNDLFQVASSRASLFRRQVSSQLQHRQADCSQCLNVDRKFQCSWCHGQCRHAEQCSELPASTCPPPRIDSIHPTSGPLEGGTLLTIQGSNLGSNEREIQDRILVGGEPCQLVMYSVSTRIVCKTGPSLRGPQAATVFVGNRAGVTSAHEQFHYKAVHLTDVTPRIGPASGGTRLSLSGSNFNIGSRLQIFLDDIPCPIDSNELAHNQIVCVTAPNLLAGSTRITRLTLTIDNSTHTLPFPFTYQPDPIITSIEPAESFLSGGRLILISGHHLASPQSTKLMVYHEHKHNIVNATNCITQNDTLITCLTPAISRDLLGQLDSLSSSSSSSSQQAAAAAATTTDWQTAQILGLDNGGLKLKMSLFMDDVKSVRNLDEYYHHLPHFLTYYEDPQLFRLASQVVDFTHELVIPGENLRMKQLDRDMLITIGSSICVIKSLSANQLVCEPPQRIAPVFDESNRLVDRPILPIVALIGSNLAYQIGHMQYSSRQYQLLDPNNPYSPTNNHLSASGTVSGSSSVSESTSITSPSVAILICLSVLGFIVGFAATFMFAVSRFRQSKAEREYKRIQLQMGSLDVNGQPINGNLFDNIHINNSLHSAQAQSARSRALEYVGGALSGKKLFYQFNQQLPSFPPSPLTDISSLAGSNPVASHNQHLVKLSSNGNIINSTTATTTTTAPATQNNNSYHHYNTANSNSSQSSPGSTRNSGHHLFGNNQAAVFSNAQLQIQHQQRQQTQQKQPTSDRSNLLATAAGLNLNQSHNLQPEGNSRNFNWTQEAPSTIVPYAVIEACDLSLKGKNAIKEYV